mgnify:CR=1 FL=1
MASFEGTLLDWLQATCLPHGRVPLAIGDDGALVSCDGARHVVIAADLVAEGRHFNGDADPYLVGRKALARNLSDLAAMGARPLAAVATCALRRGTPLEYARELTRGLRDLGTEWDCPLVGGDTATHEAGLVLSVTVLGALVGASEVKRSGARVGHQILVTGGLGRSWKSDRHLQFAPRLRESWSLCQRGASFAMMDISDGLLLDLHRMADASGVGFRLDMERIPCSPGASLQEALSDGEDYELLFTWPREDVSSLLAEWPHEVPLTVVGEILQKGRHLRTGDRIEVAAKVGYEHD